MISLMLALLVGVMPATEAEPTPLPDDQYAETWTWCADRYAGQPELVEACQWGAFGMIYQDPIEQEWRA